MSLDMANVKASRQVFQLIAFFLAFGSHVSALDFEEGQEYCVGEGTRVCESILEVKNVTNDGFIFEETWRINAPLVLSQYRSFFSPFEFKLTSQYKYQDGFLCETDFLDASFRNEGEQGRTTFLFGKEVRLADDPGLKIKTAILDHLEELERCFQFDDSCMKDMHLAQGGVWGEVQSTLRRGYFFGNFDTVSQPWLETERGRRLVPKRRFGDSYLIPLEDLEAYEPARKYVLQFVWWQPVKDRIDNAASLLPYDEC